MPEGPEIRRAADKLAAVMIDQPLTEVWFAFPQLKHYQADLIDECITTIELWGKALLTDCSNGLTMYSHRCGAMIEKMVLSSRPFYWRPERQT